MQTQSVNFLGNYHRPQYHTKTQNRRGASFPDPAPMDSFQRTQQRNYNKKKPSVIRTKIAAVFSAIAIAIGGCGGYSIGKEQSDKESYLAGFNDGKQQAYTEFQNQNKENSYCFQNENLVAIDDYIPNELELIEELNTIPQKVTTLAPDDIVELDLTQKPYLYKDDIDLPDYFEKNGIDLDVLKTAQYNCARVFESGNYIIISPKQDTTMGEIKRVFGILDEVIGKDSANEIESKKHISGSNGNMDNAILEKDDAIRIKKYDSEKGHQVGVYTAHKSNTSRQKIADEILKWADK